MKSPQLSAQIEGLKLNYQKLGSGPPMLLIHGLLGGSFCWRFSLPVLAEQFTVHAVDLPGLAFSDDVGIDCSISCQARRLSRFIEVMDWQDLTLIGSSFGGAIAMMLAARDNQSTHRIRNLVLCAPVNPWSQLGSRRIRLLSSRLGGLFLRAGLPISHPVHRIAVRRMYGDPKRMPQDSVEGYRRSVLRRGRAENVLTALRSWQKDLDNLLELIPQIAIPALLVWGECDPAVDPRSALELQNKLRNAELKIIPGAGHLPFEEMPEEFNLVVTQFLRKPENLTA